MAITSLYSLTSKETMIAGFPTKTYSITCTPALRGVITLSGHMTECAQSQYTIYSILNRLFLVVPATSWLFYALGTVYPVYPQHKEKLLHPSIAGAQKKIPQCETGGKINETLVETVQREQGPTSTPRMCQPCASQTRTYGYTHVAK